MFFFTKFYTIEKKQHEIYTFSRSLIIWDPAIETWAQEMNGNELGGGGRGTFPHLGNYTLTQNTIRRVRSLL